MEILERILMPTNEANLNAYRFVTEIGLAKNVVSEWRNGRIMPSADTLVKIADCFNVSLDYLVGRSAFKEKNNEIF
jgi:transcriptional regulator with XRE-family HTH domain